MIYNINSIIFVPYNIENVLIMKKIYLNLIALFLLSIFSLSAQSTDGTDFWLTFGRNWREGTSSICGSSSTDKTPVIPRIRIVTKDFPLTHVEIEFTELPESSPYKRKSYDIPARTPIEYAMDDTNDPFKTQRNACYLTNPSPNPSPGNFSINSKTVKITSNHPITVYALNQCCKSADATNLLPEPTLGKRYYQISYKCSDYVDAYAVIATENGTTEVKHNGNVVANLNKGQVYYRTSYVSSNNTGVDMTGIEITSDKDVAFFSLCQGTHIKNSSSHDHLFQQLAPVNTWGKNFLVPVTGIYNHCCATTGTYPQTCTKYCSYDRVRIVASEDNTTVTRIGGTPISASSGVVVSGNTYQMSKGKWIELEVDYDNNGCFITATEPIGVCTYLITPTSYNDEVSDPAMAWLPSMEQTAKIALIAPFAPQSGTALETHKALIIAPTDSRQKTKVTIGNGSKYPLPDDNWKINTASGMSFYNYTMPDDSKSYRFDNPDGIIVMGYGYGSAESYYYLGYSSMLKLDAFFKANGIHYQNFTDELFCTNEFEFNAEFLEPESVESLTWYIDNILQSPLDPYNWTYTFPSGSAGPHQVKMVANFVNGEIVPFEETLHIGAVISAVSNNEDWGTVTGAEEGCYEYDENITLTATANPNYRFDYWTEDGVIVDYGASFSFSAAAPHDYVAYFVPDVITVVVTFDPENVGCEVEGDGEYILDDAGNANVTLTALECEGYDFVGWFEDEILMEENPIYNFTTNQDKNLVAKFEIKKYQVTLAVAPDDDAGSVVGENRYTHGSMVTIRARESNPSYYFSKWWDANADTLVTTNLSYTFRIVEPRSFVAYFEPYLYNITLSTNPSDVGEVGGGGNDIPAGTPIEVWAIPEDFYEFVNWTTLSGTHVTFNNPYGFIVNSNRHLVANFKRESFNVIVTATEGGWAVGGGMNLPYDTLITVNAFPLSDYVFNGWTINGVPVYEDEAYSFRVNRSCTLTANFVPKFYNITVKEEPDYSGLVWGGGPTQFNEFTTVYARANQHYEFDKWTDDTPAFSHPDTTYNFRVTRSRHLVAHFRPTTYIITVDVEQPAGGYAIGDTAAHFGERVAVEAFENSNFKFSHWSDENGWASSDNPYGFDVTKSRHLVAHFDSKPYDIFVGVGASGGGTACCNGYNIPHGDMYTVTATAKTNYVFVNWTENDEPVTTKNPFTFPVTYERHLIANFRLETYHIVVQANPTTGGIVNGNITDISWGEWHTVTADANPFFEFSHWTNKAGTNIYDSPTYTFQVTSSDTLTAHFTSPLHHINLTAYPETGGSVNGGGEHHYGDYITVEALPNTGFSFKHWTEENVDEPVFPNESYSFLVTGDRNLTAHFDTLTFNITLRSDPVPGGTFTNSHGSLTGIPYNTDITITAIPNVGYVFVDWTDDNGEFIDDNPVISFPVTSSRTLVANYTYVTHEIRLLYGSGGTTQGSGIYPHGTDTMAKAIPNLLNNFLHWLEADTVVLVAGVPAGANYPFTVTHSRTLTAIFTEKFYTITTTPIPGDGGETIVVDSPTGDYESGISYGEFRTVEAFAGENYNFKHWKEGEQVVWPQPAYNFPVHNDHNLKAIFELKTFPINVSWTPPDGGYALGGGEIAFEEEAVVTAYPRFDYDFVGWKEEEQTASTSPEFRFIVDHPRNLVAHFEPKTYYINATVGQPGSGWVSGGGINLPYGTDTAVYAHANPNFKFVNWTENGNHQSYDAIYRVPVTRSRDLVANFTLQTFNVYVGASPIHAADVSGGGTNIPFGNPTTVRADAKPFYTFEKWTKDGVFVSLDNPAYTFTVAESCTLIAHFTSESFNITLRAEPPLGGNVSGGGAVHYGDSVTVKAKPELGYVFVKWTEDGEDVSTNAHYGFRVTGDRELVAHFVPANFNVTVSATPTYAGNASGGGINIPAGAETTITATANEEYEFVKWTKDGEFFSENPIYSFEVTETCHLLANFKIPGNTQKYRVNVEVNDTVFGKAYGGGFYEVDELARVWAVANSGFFFSHWTIDGNLITTTASYEFPVTEDVTLVAHFYALDFDTYAATLWNNTFILNLNLLESKGYYVTECKWLKNSKVETVTHSYDQFSYSAGPKASDLLEPAPTYYMFRLLLENGATLYSTRKLIPPYSIFATPEDNNTLLIYPNPALQGAYFVIEGVTEGNPVYVYNHFGVCVSNTIATGETISIALHVPAGIYLIRSDNKTGKVVIVK